MWLLNADTRKLEHFLEFSGPYAILSHTWGEEEVTFDDIHEGYAEQMKGSTKIDYACKQALKDDFQYIWIDTCCIDKRSSAELSEAINSMYRWYYEAYICYAFPADVRTVDGSDAETKATMSLSRWFTRGWTLQELIAPKQVEFYDANWKNLGQKTKLVELLATVTSIPTIVLENRNKLSSASIAQRMSWASGRQTSRLEDQAYALLGIFNVNMPLLYGEGKKAFLRLQHEIIKTGEHFRDHSILAWDSSSCDLLAPSASSFHGCNFVSWPALDDDPFELTRTGLRLRLPVRRDTEDPSLVTAVLNCRSIDSTDQQIALRLRVRPCVLPFGSDVQARPEPLYDRIYPMLRMVANYELQSFAFMDVTIAHKPFVWPATMPQSVSLSSGEVQLRKMSGHHNAASCIGRGYIESRKGRAMRFGLQQRDMQYASGDLLIGRVRNRQGVILRLHIDYRCHPSKLFVAIELDINLVPVVYPSEPAVRLGERRDLYISKLHLLTVEASYVSLNDELLWHLEITEAADVSMENELPALTQNIGGQPAEQRLNEYDNTIVTLQRRVAYLENQPATEASDVSRKSESSAPTLNVSSQPQGLNHYKDTIATL